MASIGLVRVTGKCPHCDVRKHQIDGTEERAMQIVGNAIDAHIREAHPERHVEGFGGASPTETEAGAGGGQG